MADYYGLVFHFSFSISSKTSITINVSSPPPLESDFKGGSLLPKTSHSFFFSTQI